MTNEDLSHDEFVSLNDVLGEEKKNSKMLLNILCKNDENVLCQLQGKYCLQKIQMSEKLNKID